MRHRRELLVSPLGGGWGCSGGYVYRGLGRASAARLVGDVGVWDAHAKQERVTSDGSGSDSIRSNWCIGDRCGE